MKEVRMSSDDLAGLLLRIRLRETAEGLDDLLARAIKQKWSHRQLLEEMARQEVSARTARNLERRLTAARIGRFIVDKLNRIDAPLRFLIPEGGLSGLDKAGGAFWDPAANKALFDVITSNFRSGGNKKLLKVPHHVNDQAFADALVASFQEIAAPWQELRAQRS